MSSYDAVVVGSGPNGLAAAIELARAGRKALVVEASDTAGGGLRSAELTEPGFIHDVCSAVHPMALASPFFRGLPLEEHGLEWRFSDVPLAHPLENGSAALLQRDVGDTAASLGRDERGYRLLMQWAAEHWTRIIPEVLRPAGIPGDPAALLRFGAAAMLPASVAARVFFRGDHSRSLFAGLAAHSILPLEFTFTTAYGVILGMLGHSVGWPVAKGGSGAIAAALVSYYRTLGGEVQTGWRVGSIDELPPAQAYLLDLSTIGASEVAGSRFPAWFHRKLRRFRYGPGVFKLDWSLDGPIPWRSPECARAATVHLGGSLEEIEQSERAAWEGRLVERPFVLLVQPGVCDSSRAPEGRHTAWAYCHVPNSCELDRTGAIEAQVERFAPGFRDCVRVRSMRSPLSLEEYNPNCVGGDISGGAGHLAQLFFRPSMRPGAYRTPAGNIFLCSACTPPGGGVHGMCGALAARAALGTVLRD